MDIYVDTKITDILEPLCKKFYSECLDEEESYYEYYKSMDQNKRFNNFIITIISDKKTFTNYYKLLIKKGCDKKEVNKFFYTYMKMKKKSEDGVFSWNEIIEMDIPEEQIKKTSTKFAFF